MRGIFALMKTIVCKVIDVVQDFINDFVQKVILRTPIKLQKVCINIICIFFVFL